MALSKKTYKDGTNQLERLLPPLDPEYFKIIEKTKADLLRYTAELTKEIIFYNPDTNLPDGNWQAFFPAEEEIDNFLSTVWSRSDHEPSIALFINYLELIQKLKNSINELLQKHVAFYYQDVLRFTLNEPVSDIAYLVLELNKNSKKYKLDTGTIIEGEDTDGNKIQFSTNREIVLNKTQVASQKSIYVDHENLPENKPLKIYSAPVANSLDGLGEEFTSIEDTKWYPFGRSQLDLPEQERAMIDAEIGFAIASPVLILKEGERTLSFTFDLKGNDSTPEKLNMLNAMEVYFSGAEEWIGPYRTDAVILLGPDQETISFSITLSEEEEAVVPMAHSALTDFDTPWPVARFMLSNAVPENNYKYLYDLQVTDLTIKVDVKNIRNLLIQNDQSKLKIEKPFNPFGTHPKIDSRFYIGSAEVFRKKLRSIDIHIDWHDFPNDGKLDMHYFAYFPNASQAYIDELNSGGTEASALEEARQAIHNDPEFGNSFNYDFQAHIDLLYNNTWENRIEISKPIFDLNTNFNTIEITTGITKIEYSRTPSIESLNDYSVLSRSGFIRMELTGPKRPFTAFGHKEYANLYSDALIEKARDPDTSNPIPNPPYTPLINELKLDYVSEEKIGLSSSNGIEQFFHIEPFGYTEIEPGDEVYLLPQYRNEGYIYMGLSGLDPAQNVNFLFEIIKGSSDTGIEIYSQDIQWSYLRNNQWIDLDDLEILIDSTQAFRTSGIISLSIPKDISINNTLLDKELHWIRASIENKVAGVNQIANIYTQAIDASRILESETSLSNSQTIGADTELMIPAGSLMKLKNKISAIKSVLQPTISVDGVRGEAEDAFFTRISERLHHKNRSRTYWDYERMVLSKFPSVYKVKCLQNTSNTDYDAPGHVTLLVISNLRNKNAQNVLQPKTSAVELNNIKSHIRSITSGFITLHVQNPVYEAIKAEFKVRFHSEYDEGFYSLEINEALKRFLSPWAYEEGEDIVFGGQIYKSDILAFIENLEYVDYVVDFKLYHLFSGEKSWGLSAMEIDLDFIVASPQEPALGEMTIGEDFVVGESVEVVISSTPRSVLVSADNHNINIIREGEYSCDGIEYEGIGYMAVGIDFEVIETGE